MAKRKTQSQIDVMRVTVVLVVSLFSGIIGYVLGKSAALTTMMTRGY